MEKRVMMYIPRTATVRKMYIPRTGVIKPPKDEVYIPSGTELLSKMYIPRTGVIKPPKFEVKKPEIKKTPFTDTNVIKFSLDQLLKFIAKENEIRESELIKNLQSNDNISREKSLDNICIKLALMSYGYEPDQDSSLKAYYTACAENIDDVALKDKIVWLNYDKEILNKYKKNNIIYSIK
jgi:hypothetical protein